MYNYLLLLSFVGTRFHGWQIQPNLRTVQGTLKDAIEKIFQQEIKLTGCCRTDAGVHAKEYIANFKAKKYLGPDTVLKALNSLLPEDLGVLNVKLVDDKFNARYNTTGKIYAYRIWNSVKKDPFLKPFVWQVPYKLDKGIMEETLRLFIGYHDFSSFAKLEEEKNTYIEIKEAKMEIKGELIEISLFATHFLRYMVRRIVGCLVYLGIGKVEPSDIQEYLKGKRACPHTAKAQGLTLETLYPTWFK